MPESEPADAKGTRIPVFATAKEAYARTWRDRRGLWPMIPPVFVAGLAASLVATLAMRAAGLDVMASADGAEVATKGVGFHALSIVFSIPTIAVGALFGVAIHRRVLLDESAGWSLLRWSRRHSLFFGLTLAFWVPQSVVFAVVGRVFGPMVATLTFLVLMLVTVYVYARCSVMLPAIAIDAFDGIGGAWRLTIRNGWRIFWVGMAVGVPVMIPWMVMSMIWLGTHGMQNRALADDVLFAVLGWPFFMALALLQVSALSLIFARLTGRPTAT